MTSPVIYARGKRYKRGIAGNERHVGLTGDKKLNRRLARVNSPRERSLGFWRSRRISIFNDVVGAGLLVCLLPRGCTKRDDVCYLVAIWGQPGIRPTAQFGRE